ncbi:MAG: hypothetical protein U0527_13005 [Candidatus Eisenbacteria bacterium]
MIGWFNRVAWLLLIVASTGCGRESSPKAMNFQVDQSVLGEPYVDRELGVTFRAPRQLLLAPTDFLKNAQTEVESRPVTDPVLDLEPTEIYADPSGEMRVFLSRFRVKPEDGMSAAWRERYEAAARGKILRADPSAKIEVDSYAIGPVPVLQLKVTGKGYTNFRLVCKAEEIHPFRSIT